MNLLNQSLLPTVMRVTIRFVLSHPKDGWDSDCLNSQLDDGVQGVVDDVGMSSPSPPSSLSRFAST